MNTNRSKLLVVAYNQGKADDAMLREIEQLLEAGEIQLYELTDLARLEEQLAELDSPSPSLALDDKFYTLLAEEKKSTLLTFSWKKFFTWPELAPRLALASVTLLIGFTIGYFLQSPTQKNDVALLSQEVSDLKEMMMLSLLEKESASERLKAVSLTNEMDASTKVTDALLKTLNHDSNVNVRLSALEALQPYAKESHVRTELIRSIARQDSPLVQIALAELMAALQEKDSVKELQKILHNSNTPKDVKKKIKQSIEVLT